MISENSINRDEVRIFTYATQKKIPCTIFSFIHSTSFLSIYMYSQMIRTWLCLVIGNRLARNTIIAHSNKEVITMVNLHIQLKTTECTFIFFFSQQQISFGVCSAISAYIPVQDSGTDYGNNITVELNCFLTQY